MPGEEAFHEACGQDAAYGYGVEDRASDVRDESEGPYDLDDRVEVRSYLDQASLEDLVDHGSDADPSCQGDLVADRVPSTFRREVRSGVQEEVEVRGFGGHLVPYASGGPCLVHQVHLEVLVAEGHDSECFAASWPYLFTAVNQKGRWMMLL